MQDTISCVYDFYSSTDMTFKTGQDKSGGRVAGTPNKTTLEGRQIALGFAAEALQALVDVLRDQEAPHAARISAATAVLDRAFGKPRQEIEQVGDAQPLQIMIKHFSADAANCVATTELGDQFNSVVTTELEPETDGQPRLI